MLGGSEGNKAAERGAWWFFGEGFSFGAQCWLHSEVEWENRKSKQSGDTEAGAPHPPLCCNKGLQTGWLKTAHTYHLTVLELGKPRSVSED